jgi:hypothetical protein
VRSLVVAVVLVLAPLLSAGTAAAEPPCTVRRCRIESPSTLKTDGGSELRLPPGTFFPAPERDRFDVEMKRLQDRETKLAAENKSLRASAEELPFGWPTIIAVAAAAVAGGVGALVAF